MYHRLSSLHDNSRLVSHVELTNSGNSPLRSLQLVNEVTVIVIVIVTDIIAMHVCSGRVTTAA